MINTIIKRDGTPMPFDSLRITNAIIKAMNSVGRVNDSLALKVTRDVINKLKNKSNVDEVLDVIELVLKINDSISAQSLSLYRARRSLAREFAKSAGIKDDLKLSLNSLKVIASRYLLRDKTGSIIESTSEMFRRVARSVAVAEKQYGGDARALEEEFYNLMIKLEFLPNSPTIMNAGTSINQLSACYVLPVNDSLDSIFSTLKDAVLIHHSGGGVGFNFSHLRPNGDAVSSTSGVASGPVSFIRIYDMATSIIKQGGRRRGANMAVLNHNHPDIIEFINAKKNGGFINFNFSVSVTDSFIRKVIKGGDYWLVNPKDNSHVKKVSAQKVFNQLCANAWTNGEPGLLFIDEINHHHPLKELVDCTNPCGEQPLLPYESCNLGSINLSKMIVNNDVDWARLNRVTRLGVRFLDDVLTINEFPVKLVKDLTMANRKIGLGVMGFADLLIKLGIPYDSKESLKLAGQLMKFINDKAHDESMRLGLKRGSFTNFKKSRLSRKYKAMRNATLTTIAPTGSISLMADCSSSIEPLFAVAFYHSVLDGDKLLNVNHYFENELVKQGLYSNKLINNVVNNKIELPAHIKRVFRTALDIKPEWHVRLQAMFQKYVDNAVSKTVNLPHEATINDVMKVFLLAYKLNCKGITVYRYGSRDNQVLTIGSCPTGSCD
ncbi:MAG: adenosylcobalamin-dependent ribonucleoside-diphosphate reductase [Candidatus Nanoarchaeia archaeon]|jgi:ribonucleoside-diphosphate reductase alpha chain